MDNTHTNGARHRSAAGRFDAVGASPKTQSTSEFGSEYGRKISWSPDIPQAPNPKVKVTDYVPSNSTRRRSSLQIGTNTTIKSGWAGALLRRKQKLGLDLAKRGWNLNRILWRTLAAIIAVGLLIRYFVNAERQSHHYPGSGPRKVSYGRGGKNNSKGVKYIDESESWSGLSAVGDDHQFGADGWFRSHVSKSGQGGRHPIWDLMEDADHKYEDMVKNQPSSLKALAQQYKDTFGRAPPLHYDTLAPHLFAALPYSPLASPNSLHMYFSNPPALLHKRQQSTESHYEGMDEFTGGDEATDAGKFVIVVKDGQPTVEWPWNAKDFNGHPYPGFDADLQVRLQRWLSRPEWQGAITDLRLTVNMEELNPQLISGEYKAAALKRSKEGQFELDQGERRDRTNHDNWALGCPADSALVKGEPGSFGAAIGRGHGIYTPSFIHSPKKAASYCLHPALAPFSPVLALQPEPIDVQTRPVPHLTSRTGLSGLASDILVLGINNKIRTNGANGEVPWDQKHGHGIFWRGPSPEFDEPLTAMNAVKISSPVRLMLLSSTPIDHYTFPSTLISPLNVVDAGLVPSSSRKHSKKQYNFKVNTEERISSDIWTRGNYLDVAFTGYGLSCDGLPGCDGLNKRVKFDNDWRNLSRQKFVMILDAEDPREAFEAGSLVFYASATGMSAWQTKAIPWRDYVPVSPDFSDLPSIVNFLRANDDQASRIASNGRDFALKVLSEEAYDVSLIGTLMEWSRIWADSRPLRDLNPEHL